MDEQTEGNVPVLKRKYGRDSGKIAISSQF